MEISESKNKQPLATPRGWGATGKKKEDRLCGAKGGVVDVNVKGKVVWGKREGGKKER